MNITVQGVKERESEKMDKYLDLAREFWNINVTVILFVGSALGMVSKGLRELLIRRRIKTNQTVNISLNIETNSGDESWRPVETCWLFDFEKKS